MIDWLLSPLSWLLLATVLVALGWRWRARSRWVLRAAVVVLVLAFAAMTPFVANGLVGLLERPIVPAASCVARPPHLVIVLGGGVDRRPRGASDFDVLGLASRRRVDAAVRYWKSHPGARLVMSGGPVGDRGPSHAGLMAGYAQWLGVPRHAIALEGRSGNTWEAALEVAGRTSRQQPRVVLVTSAMHMPRALAAFHAAGLVVCPVAADYRQLPLDPWGIWLPRPSALLKSQAAIHELAGLAYYRWRARHGPGRTPASD